MKDEVLSPISGKAAKFIQSLEVSLIVDLYKNELNISVGKYFGNTTQVSIYECSETGYRFYFPLDLAGDADFYSSLQSTGTYYPQWKWENEKALEFIKSTDHVLDVGCGEGNFLKELYKKNITNICGIDLSSEALTLSESNTFPIYNETIETFSNKNKNTCDVVVCFQILEHITDVSSFIKSCLNCLKPGGLLFIAVPNNNPYIYRHDLLHTLNLPPHHAGLWNKNSLGALSSYFGLKLILNEVQPISQNVSEYTYVQLKHLTSSKPFFKWLFGFELLKKIYSKILFTRKNKIEGRNCVAIYQKINTLNDQI